MTRRSGERRSRAADESPGALELGAAVVGEASTLELARLVPFTDAQPKELAHRIAADSLTSHIGECLVVEVDGPNRAPLLRCRDGSSERARAR